VSLDLRLRAYAPNGAALGILPTPEGLSASAVRGDVGAVSIGYPKAGPRQFLEDPCEVAVEVTYDDGLTWAEPDNMRFLRLRRSGDQVENPNTRTYEGPAYVWRLSKANVLPGVPSLLNAEGKRPFVGTTPGGIIRTLTLEAQTRGALAGMDFTTFTTYTDSAGVAWPTTVPAIYYEPGLDYLSVLMNLQQQGLLDFSMRGRSLRLYVPDTVQGGDSAATLQRGRDLSEAPYAATLEGLASYAYLMGDDGVSFSRTNVEAEAPWGRWETFISQGGVKDVGTMTVLTDAALSLAGSERVENTYGLTFAITKHLPFRDYDLGQFVGVRTGLGVPVSLRVMSITLARDDKGVVDGNVVLNDRFLENEVKQARRITGITGGATTDGGTGGTPAPPKDTTIPKAPAGLTSSSDAYLDAQGKVWATITVNWAAVTLNTDNTAITDLSAYYVYYKLPTDTVWQNAGTKDATALTHSFGQLMPNTHYDVAVRARDSTGHWSAYSAVLDQITASDATGPAQPSTPGVLVYLGQVLISWDGLNSVGGAMPTDFARTEIHLGTSPTFTPSAATLVDTITSRAGGSTVATGLTYGTSYYARLVAYDISGNVSPVSTASAAAVPLKAATGDITSITANQITAGVVSAAITISGRIATALTGARVELQALGIKAYDSGGVLTVDVPSAGTGATFTGKFSTGFSGARVVMDAALGSASVLLYSGMASETAPGGLSTTVFGSGSAADAVLTVAAPQKNSLDRASIQLRSRDADTGADISFAHYNGSIYWQSDATFGSHFYQTNGGSDWFRIQRNGNGSILGGVGGGQNPYIAMDSGGLSLANGTDNFITIGTLGHQDTLTLSAKLVQIYSTDSAYNVKIIGDLDHSGGTILMTDEFGQYRLRALSDGTGPFIQSQVLYQRTYTGTANVVVNSTFVMGRITSSARYKVNIDRDYHDLVDLDAIKRLRSTSYYDRGNAERLAELLDGGPDEDVERPRLLVGLIAEDVEALGLTDLVTYGDDDRVNGVQYERLAVHLLPWLGELEARLDRLERATLGA
jgi:hypothetical protein